MYLSRRVRALSTAISANVQKPRAYGRRKEIQSDELESDQGSHGSLVYAPGVIAYLDVFAP